MELSINYERREKMKKILKISVACLLFVAVMLSFTSCSIIKPTMDSVRKNLEKEDYICEVAISQGDIEAMLWCDIEYIPRTPRTVIKAADKTPTEWGYPVCFVAVEFDSKRDAQDSEAILKDVLPSTTGFNENWITGINGNIFYACEQSHMVKTAFGPLYGAMQGIIK